MSRFNQHLNSIVLATGVFAVQSYAVSAAFNDSRFMTSAGELTGKLELSVTQQGFAGRSGIVWIIAPNGEFQASRFLNENTSASHLKGKLDSAALQHIARILQQQDFLGLPSETGQSPPVNPKWIEICFGIQKASLMLPPGQSLQDASRESDLHGSDPSLRLLIILNSILEQIDPNGMPQ